MAKPRSSFFGTLENTTFGRLSLRTKLISGNLLITFLAITGMGYYVYFRTQETNASLADKLRAAVRTSVDNKLSTTSREQAALLNGFFDSMRANVLSLGKIEKSILSEKNRLNGSTSWDAHTSVFRLPDGAWDNSNSEIASIFLPADVELSDELASKLGAMKETELIVPTILQDNPDIIAIYFGGTSKETIYFPNIDLANVVPADFSVIGRPWYVAASPAENPDRAAVWSVPYQDAALNGLVITTSVPVFDAFDRFQGVTAMDIQLNRITDLVSGVHVGETGYAFLIDKDNRLIALPEAGYRDFGLTSETVQLGEVLDQAKQPALPSDLLEVLKLKSNENSIATLNVGGVERFVVYQQIPAVGYSLVILVPSAELLAETSQMNAQISEQTRNIISTSIFLVIIILAIASLATLAIGNGLTAPLETLTGVANEITKGNYDAKADVQSLDEIGALGTALNQMTAQLNQSFYELERRVADRTTDLEIARRLSDQRAQELQSVGEISKLITGEQKMEVLLPLICRLVSESFGYYHVGIFLLDETGQFAVLQAANSSGGKEMLTRGHRLDVGEAGIVGHVAKTGAARIALDVGSDPVFFNNSDLPNTRSEMALPLKVHDRIVGVLDLQSEKPGAFSETDASTLSIMTDQIGISLENAKLFAQNQQALGEAQALYRQNSQESWLTFSKEEASIGYQQTIKGGKRLSAPVETAEIREAMNRGNIMVYNKTGESKEATIVVPIKLRGQIIGALNIKAPSVDRRWSNDEVNLAEAVSERLSLALENARLIQESQRQVIKEQTISDVTSKIGASINLRNVLQTAVEELGRAIPGSDVLIQFNSDDKQRDS